MRHACFHPGYLRKMVARLAAEGNDPEQLLAPAKFTWESLQVRESMLSFEQGRLIVLACQNAAGRPTLGIEEGRAIQLADHGPLGWLMSVAANLREALQALDRFSSLRTGVWNDLVVMDQEGLWIVVEPAFPLGDVKAFLLDHFAGVTSRLLATISNHTLDAVRFEVPWAPPAWKNAYHAVAGTVTFNAKRAAFWLPNQLLDRPNPMASRLDFREAWQLCEAKVDLIHQTRTLRGKLRYLLERTDVDWEDKEAIAARVGVSASTLFRYLRKEGTSFMAVRDEVRLRRAVSYLEYSNLSVRHIAHLLGYHSESNFSRAFRRWTGTTPVEHRKGKSGTSQMT